MMGSGELRAAIERSIRDGRLRFPGGQVTLDGVGARAAGLRAAGLQERQAVGMVFDNGVACVEAYAACLSLDVVAVPFPPTLPAAERLRLWSSVGCRAHVDATGVHAFEGAAVERGDVRWPSSVLWVMHSSGSTGTPKAIPLTAAAVATNAAGTMALLGLGGEPAHLGTMSQCYTNGLYNSFLLPLLTGGVSVVGPVASALRFRQFLEIIRTERPDILWVNPTVVSMLLRQASAEDLASVQVLVSCTAPLTREDCLAAEKKFGKPVLQSFGTTETLIVSVELPGRDAATTFSSGAIVGGPGAVAIGADGVLRIHNGAVTPGYAVVDAAQLTMILPDGGVPEQRFVSGDLARFNAAGYLEIIGRTTNVINVEGVKISVEQLEEVLRSDSQIADAVVVPVRDATGRERPAAFVEARGAVDAERLIELCAARLGTKARLAGLTVVPALPRTSNGKIDRQAVSTRFSSS